MGTSATFTADNGATIIGELDDEHTDCRNGEVVFVVNGRARRATDLPPGQVRVVVEQRTLGVAGIVSRAQRVGFDVRFEVTEIRRRRR